MHIGKDVSESLNNQSKYQWEKAKLSDLEIADIARVLSNQIDKASFFHEYNGNKKQIWINTRDGSCFFRIRELSKSLSAAEQYVLLKILDKMIVLKTINDKNKYVKEVVDSAANIGNVAITKSAVA